MRAVAINVLTDNFIGIKQAGADVISAHMDGLYRGETSSFLRFKPGFRPPVKIAVALPPVFRLKSLIGPA